MSAHAMVAYLSMEIGVDAQLPTCCGGLGVLAGDTTKGAAEVDFPLVGVSLRHHKGYFEQEIENCQQKEVLKRSNPFGVLRKRDEKVKVQIEGIDVTIGAEEYIIRKYHMNEGHTALATLEIANNNNWNERETKKKFSFTTHTLVPAGHEVFPIDMVENILEDSFPLDKITEYGGQANCLNMTKLAMSLSDYQNGVSKKNAEAAREMFPNKKIDYITNAVHLGTWTSGSFKGLYDRHFHGWEENPEKLKDAMRLPNEEVWKAHLENKNILVDFIEDEIGIDLDRNILTLGWFRRIAEYKRPTLIFTEKERLKHIGSGKIQILMAGKAHPRDIYGKKKIRKIY